LGNVLNQTAGLVCGLTKKCKNQTKLDFGNTSPKFKSILTAMQYVQTMVLALIVDLVEQPPNTTLHA
jgi:hypothetical protein